MAGYSGVPLSKKLGIKEGFKVLSAGAPRGYRALLQPLPPYVTFVSKPDQATSLVHFFCTRRIELARALAGFRKALGPNAVVWVSWPKKSAGVPTDITENVVRQVALPLGYVDIKVCAVTNVWSGLKLVVRRERR